MIRFTVAAALVALSTSAFALPALDRAVAAKCDDLSCYGKANVMTHLKTLGGQVTLDSKEGCEELNKGLSSPIPCEAKPELRGRSARALGASDMLTIKDNWGYTECFSLECHGKNLIALGWNRDELTAVKLRSRAECEYVNFARMPEIACSVR